MIQGWRTYVAVEDSPWIVFHDHQLENLLFGTLCTGIDYRESRQDSNRNW